jgi:hypothetical protein
MKRGISELMRNGKKREGREGVKMESKRRGEVRRRNVVGRDLKRQMLIQILVEIRLNNFIYEG